MHDIEIETCFLNWKFNLRPTLIYGWIQINIEIEKYFAGTILLAPEHIHFSDNIGVTQ